jgi:hypothetical protein
MLTKQYCGSVALSDLHVHLVSYSSVLQTPEAYPETILAVAFLSDSRPLSSALAGGRIKLRDVDLGEVLRTLEDKCFLQSSL